MLSRFNRFLTAVVVVVALSLPFAAAQSDDISVKRGVEAPQEQKSSGSSSPVFPAFVMVLYTLVVLTIVCMPSRKA
jgi:hypothetical protein